MFIQKLNRQIRAGYRMSLPLDTPPEFVLLIEKHAWNESSNNRYTMGQVCKALEQITRLPRPKPGDATGGSGVVFFIYFKNNQ